MHLTFLYSVDYTTIYHKNPNYTNNLRTIFVRNLSLSGTQDTRIKVNRKQSHPISQEQQPPQTLNHPSSPMLLSPSTNKGGGLIGIESYDKKRENTLNSIQRGIQSPGRHKHIFQITN